MALTINQLLKMQSALSSIELSLLSNQEKVEDFIEKLKEQKDFYNDKIEALYEKCDLTDAQQEKLDKYEGINEDLEAFIEELEVTVNAIDDAKSNCADASSSIAVLLASLS